MYKMFQLLGLLVTAGLLSAPCMAETFHVTPTLPAPADCPQPCYTLDQLAQNQNLLSGHNNITLIFLEGFHNLSKPLYVQTNLIILRPVLPTRQRPTVIGRFDSIFGQFTMRASNTLIEEIMFNNIFLLVDVLENDDYGFTVTIRWCDFYGDGTRGVLAIGNPFKNNIVDSSVAIKNSTMSHAFQGVYVGEVKKVLIEDSMIFQNYLYGVYTAYTPNVTIVNSYISGNRIGIVSRNSVITLRNSQIDSNDFGVVLSSTIDKRSSFIYGSTQDEHLISEMDYCCFTRNRVVGIWLFNQEGTIFRDCIFDNNSETPILAYGSTFHLSGENVFSNNIAVRGGGLALYQSIVSFDSGSTTRFENNTAKEYGGGIYIATDTTLPPQLRVVAESGEVGLSSISDTYAKDKPCFYSNNATSGDTQVKLFKNIASFGGRDIFGLTEVSYFEYICSVSEDSIFDFDDSVQSNLQLASDPSRVCFCVNNTPQCQNSSYLVLNETRFPGESFETSVALVGFNFGRVTGAVFATVLDGKAGNISDIQRIQYIDDYVQCRKLKYTVFSKQTSRPLQLSLSAEESFVQDNHDDIINESAKSLHSIACNYPPLPCTALLTTAIFINITVDICPLGFQLNNTSGICECDDSSNQLKLTCEIQNHTGVIIREGTVWVGVDTAENETDLYYWHQYCPSDYCNGAKTRVQLRSPDSQCNSNRAGILCGRCEGNYSLQLGGNRCIQCPDDSFVALLIMFTILGILLVAMITLLDFTVSNGTINGLIFYANVVWINNAILFPQQNRQNIGYYIITVPIAWINLDFGIETCFSQNLDQLTKSGLQFVFPAYVWCIAGLIILVSRHSIKATRFFGRNSVGVLSTLIPLSYGKLFRIITNAFTKADISDSNGSIRKIWSLDGNVEYGITPGHIVLMLVALLFILLFWLPFTLTLILVPFLKAKSDYRPLRWINTFIPFFDTFYGPFKDKQQHQVWTGILLISRVVILIVSASTSTSNPNANILVLTIIATLLLVYTSIVGYLYKQWFASVLEVLFLLNLIILGGTFLFYQIQPQDVLQKDTVNPVTATSVCIALLQFACIIIFHITKKIGPKLQRLATKRKAAVDIESVPRKENAGYKVTTQVVTLDNAKQQRNTYNSTDYREPLLDDT